jgi:hypothetical protein
MIKRLISLFLLTVPVIADEPAPDFKLVDANKSSPRSGELVSPRDYFHQVTAYYFGDPN